jgi:RNA polymerase sigma-70 factor (ECF subfamily)
MIRRNSITTRSLLLERLKDVADEEGWREFVGLYREFIRRLALKARLTEHEAEDVVQEVLVSVARNIKGFKYDPAVSSFRHWLTKVIRWRIADQHKRRLRETLVFATPLAGRSRTHQVLQRIPDSETLPPDEELEREWGRAIVAQALDRVKASVSSKQYQIYYLHVLKEKPVPEVCRRL